MSATHNRSGASAVKERPTRSGRTSAAGDGTVVRGPLARLMPRSPAAFINRYTVQRATRRSWRFSSACTFAIASLVAASVHERAEGGRVLAA
ncbi:hypothetical protein NI17_009580 [Thermobifida halotolerans]|uniref:Uncharacterized protein n=1 Tax=Thermobifida halotolerans TaxID=483545 RepID=A0AA97M5D4_9ACTN|nr:hypothetical protein [Thermobifida halotolerans]UOE21344.1 hypothetical protein NI17_009580 [Thermobifida halotolerans]